MPEAAAASAAGLPARGTLLAFDFGLARIGVAVGELETRHANPLLTVHEEASAARFAVIARLLDEWKPVALVVGLPGHLDGREHELAPRCRRFANQLHGRFGIPVHLVDERLSSAAAERQLHDAGLSGWQARKPVLDAVAAQLILQHFLDLNAHAPA